MLIETENDLSWSRVESALVSAGLTLERIDAKRWRLRSSPTNYRCHLCGAERHAGQCVQIGKEILCIDCYGSQRG